MFACGVILFLFYAKDYPFEIKASSTDKYYKHMFMENPEAFWSSHFEDKEELETRVNEEIRAIISCMLAWKPENRPTME